MLLVIFGAGASYDSDPSRPLDPSRSNQVKLENRPPLANELFEYRASFVGALARFPRCHPVVPYLRHLPKEQTLENELERLREEAAHYPEGERQLAAVQWYLHYVLWQCDQLWNQETKGVTNYKTLLDQIDRWRKKDDKVCLVTFNYDRLLDQVMPTVGVKIEGLNDYISNPTYKIIKIHGSVNWAREVETDVPGIDALNVWQTLYWLIDHTPDIKVSQKLHYVTDWPIGKVSSRGAVPALAIPMATKTDSNFECPPEHLDALRALLPEVKKILIIGWRGTEAHFVKLLKEHIKVAVPVMVVAGRTDWARETCATLSREVPIDSIAAQGGFTDFILRREGESFLKS